MIDLSIGVIGESYVLIPIWLAENEGAFERLGLRIRLHSFGSTHGVSEGLERSEVNVTISTPEGTIANAARGGGLRLLGGFVQKPPLSMIAQPRFKSLQDLRGAALGTTSLVEGTRHLIEKMLSSAGLRYPADYSFTMAGAHPQRWEALKKGTLDAAIQLTPFNYMAEDAGYSQLGDVVDFVPDWLFCAICTNIDWAAAHRETVVNLLLGLLYGVERLFHDPEFAAKLLQEKLPVGEAYALRACHEYVEREFIPPDLSLSAAAYDAVVTAMKTTGEIQQDVAIAVASDLSYLNEAKQRLRSNRHDTAS